MRECVCGTPTLDDRRTCPNCGREINPAGIDPGVQDQLRSTTIIAELRQQACDLTQRTELAEQRRTVAEAKAEHLQASVAELAAETESLTLEQLQLRERHHAVEERSRTLRSRFAALGISTFRPFSAEQASLFDEDRL